MLQMFLLKFGIIQKDIKLPKDKNKKIIMQNYVMKIKIIHIKFNNCTYKYVN